MTESKKIFLELSEAVLNVWWDARDDGRKLDTWEDYLPYLAHLPIRYHRIKSVEGRARMLQFICQLVGPTLVEKDGKTVAEIFEELYADPEAWSNRHVKN